MTPKQSLTRSQWKASLKKTTKVPAPLLPKRSTDPQSKVRAWLINHAESPAPSIDSNSDTFREIMNGSGSGDTVSFVHDSVTPPQRIKKSKNLVPEADISTTNPNACSENGKFLKPKKRAAVSNSTSPEDLKGGENHLATPFKKSLDFSNLSAEPKKAKLLEPVVVENDALKHGVTLSSPNQSVPAAEVPAVKPKEVIFSTPCDPESPLLDVHSPSIINGLNDNQEKEPILDHIKRKLDFLDDSLHAEKNLETTNTEFNLSPTPEIQKDHPVDQPVLTYELCPHTGILIEVNADGIEVNADREWRNQALVLECTDGLKIHNESVAQEKTSNHNELAVPSNLETLKVYELCPITGNLIEVIADGEGVQHDIQNESFQVPGNLMENEELEQDTELVEDIRENEMANQLRDGDGNEDAIAPQNPVTDGNATEKVFLGRKRSKDTTRWIAKKAQKARHAGEAYTNREGKAFPAKTMGPGCDEASCFLKCQSKISMTDRSKAKDAFYQMPNQVRKWDYIRSHVKSATPQKVKNKENPKRKCSNQYHLSVNGKKVRVCQTMFLHTLVISDWTVRTALSKQNEGGAVLNDNRGGKKAKHLTPEEVTRSMAEHIALFPRVPSHYCRAHSNYEYIETELESTSNMHKLYLQWMKSKGKDKVASERQYRDYFNSLPIKIHKPKKDMCDECVAFQNKTEKTEQDVQKYEKHLLSKDLVNALYEKDRVETAPAHKEMAICAYDLQKILLLPKSQAGALYYKRKISNFNFTIYDLGRHEGYCFVLFGRKGANEMASFVYMFMNILAALGIKVFRFYTDNCTAQNKNRFLFAMYLLASVKLNVRIEHRYLIKGHTHSAADNMHALIERKTRNRNVFTTEQWCRIMEDAKVKGKKYSVTRVTQNDIWDFHKLGESLNFKQMQISDIVEIACDPESLWTFEVNYEDFTEAPVLVNVKNKNSGRPFSFQTYEPPLAYSAPLPISANKKKDLDELISSNIIPQEYASYYQNFKVGGVEDEP